MDAKIKELLTRLSFFAEDGMADKPIVEIAKQADALLLEEARKPNTQQPVAWRHKVVEPDGSEGVMFSHGKDCPWVHWKDAYKAGCVFTVQPLYTAPPVPRDVLMALAEEVQAAVKNAARAEYSDHTREDEVVYDPTNLAAIADRYASKVQAEPVNQQQAGVYHKFKVSRIDGRDQPGGDRHGAEYFVLDVTHDKFAKPALAAYAAACRDTYPSLADDMVRRYAIAAEAAQPVASCTNSDAWNCKYCRKTEQCEALKDNRNFVQTASAQPVAVPDEITVSMAPHSQYAKGWNACRRAVLSAAQKPEGV